MLLSQDLLFRARSVAGASSELGLSFLSLLCAVSPQENGEGILSSEWSLCAHVSLSPVSITKAPRLLACESICQVQKAFISVTVALSFHEKT